MYALEFIRNTAPGKLFSFELAPSVRAELLAVTELLLKSAVDRELPARDMLSVLLSDSGT